MTHPDILLVQCDSLPADLVGAYGDPAGATPHLDALARRGTVFTAAACNAPLCAPSRASMMTGLLPSRLDCFDNAGEFSSEWPTIAHVARSVGHRTAIVGKMHFVGHDQHHGFDERLALETDYSRRFDPALYRLAYDWDQPSAVNPNSPQMMGRSYVRERTTDAYRERYRRELHTERDEAIHRAALEYLTRPHEEPFLAVVSYHAPHNPFWAPDALVERFAGAAPRLRPERVAPIGTMDRWLHDFHDVGRIQDRLLEPDNLRWLHATVYAMLHELDTRLGELLAALPRPERTVVVVTSDHGDMLGDRGTVQKRSFYERSVRVPLVVALPDGDQVARVDHPVSLVDLLPTVADLLGTPAPADIDGVSLVPAMRGDAGTHPPVVAEYHGEGVHAPCFMVRSGRHKYVLVHGHDEHLFELDADPGERVDLAGDPAWAPVRDRLRAVLGSMPQLVEGRARTSQRRRRYVLDAVVR